MKKNVLIISYYFPPLNIMAAKRFGYMCKYLEENGYKPYVITTKYRSGAYYLDCSADLPVPIDEKQIFRIGSMGWIYPTKSLAFTLLNDYLENKKMWSWLADAQAVGWYEKVKNEINLDELKDIDIVIATFPTMENTLVAKYLAKKLGIPFLADIRDLISGCGETPPGLNRAVGADKFLEMLLLWNVDGVVTVTQGFRKILKKRYPWIKVATIYNGWEEKLEHSANQMKKYLYYAGTLYEHRVESLTLLMEALEEIDISENITLRIRSLGPQHFDKQLEDFIQQRGLCDRVELLQAVTEDIVRQEQKEAYINLVPSSLHKDDLALMTTLPGKLFELLTNEAPILAIVPEEAEISEILRITEKGIASTDKEEIKGFIKNAVHQYRGNKNVDLFSRKYQTKELCSFMDEILQQHKSYRRNR